MYKYLLALILIAIIIIFNKKDLIGVLRSILLPLISTLLVFGLVLSPREVIEASKNGIIIWANTVLPSLLPFFIGTEILIGLGVVKFIGTLIEPFVRFIFNVPGEASFVFAMSIASGYPMGAKLTARLRKENIINRVEAQRMVSFCNTSGPLFMIGAVSIGMFQNPYMGIIVVLAHYLGALTVGFLFRFYKYKNEAKRQVIFTKNVLKKAFNEMLKARKEDGRSFGKLLGDSVRESVSTLLLICGLMTTFSVIIEELSLFKVYKFISERVMINEDIIKMIISGFIEITMGCKSVSEINLHQNIQIILVTAIISWSGLSVIAQSLSILNETDIDGKIYIFSKILHSIFSGIYAYIFLLFNDVYQNRKILESFMEINKGINYSFLRGFTLSIILFMVITITLLIISLIFRKTRIS